MRKILIVGAGQAGLQLALSLQAEGYDVTVMSARTPDEIRNGWPTSTQVMMYRALDREREVKLNLWDGTATPIGGIGFNLSPAPGVSAFSFSGAWARPGNSVDQRLKMPTWIELFEQRGGRVIYHSVMTSDLSGLAPMYDLTIIAAGKGEIVELDRGYAPFTPQWMQETFDAYWAHAQNSMIVTEMMLEPMPPHAQQVLGAAAQFQEIADKFAEVFPNPASVHDFLLDPATAAAYVESVAAAH